MLIGVHIGKVLLAGASNRPSSQSPGMPSPPQMPHSSRTFPSQSIPRGCRRRHNAAFVEDVSVRRNLLQGCRHIHTPHSPGPLHRKRNLHTDRRRQIHGSASPRTAPQGVKFATQSQSPLGCRHRHKKCRTRRGRYRHSRNLLQGCRTPESRLVRCIHHRRQVLHTASTSSQMPSACASSQRPPHSSRASRYRHVSSSVFAAASKLQANSSMQPSSIAMQEPLSY